MARVEERSFVELFFALRRDPLGYLLRCAATGADLAVFRIGRRTALVAIFDPELIQEVLVRRTNEFWKAHVFERGLPWAKAILGSGLLMSEGKDWLRQRRLMQPAFHRTTIARSDGIVVEAAAAMVARWERGRPRDVHADASAMVVETLARVVFGLTPEARALEPLLRETFAHRPPTRLLLNLLPEWVPTPANVRTRTALARLDRAILGIIARRRAAGESEDGSLISLLVAATDEDGTRFTDRQVRDEVMSTLVAGTDTLAATLSWALHALAQRVAVQDRLRGELRAALDGRAPTAEDLPGLVYLDGVAREVLRLFPAGKNVVRVAAQATEVGGVRVESGTNVILSQWAVQRDPRWFRHPEELDPGRWEGGLASTLPKAAFFPFGLGPRLCLGRAFADDTLRLMLATVVSRVGLTPAAEPATTWDIALQRPRAGVWLVPRDA